MTHVWLEVIYNDSAFDVLIEDTDKSNLMELFEYMFEDSVKQSVYLPKYFTLFIDKPRTNRKLELCDDTDFLKMWEWNEGKETIKVWIQATDVPGMVFKSAEATWQKKIKDEAEKQRCRLEKIQAERELMEQQQYIVVVEVPVVNADNSGVEYMRVFDTDVVDEMFPGASQPQPSQHSTPPKQSQPTSPPNNQTKKTPRKTMASRRKKGPKTKSPPQPKSAPQTECPPQPESAPQPEPPPHPHPDSPIQPNSPPLPDSPIQPQPNAPSQQSQPQSTQDKPKKGGRTRPTGFRVSKKTAVKQGIRVEKGLTSSRRKIARIGARSEDMVNSDSEDDD
ncbi:wiskott-Aldrich syndrome protein family member 2-like [Chenopodium quinoa]|uniref:wiskott-Aldrich syndrome protein family member 2-like n=1 Tax=Chenopodium quinoa TaxID=63459 RepID=UPI000B77E08C|nr:wiskott-Aldrich syndrome protein family member 2-like [Chenopodium quinoa]